MIAKIKGKFVMIVNGKVSWAMDNNGWYQDIFEVIDGSKVKVNGVYTESQFRYRMTTGRMVFE